MYVSSLDILIRVQGFCPPWIRIDRTDGVADTSPYVRIIDEAVDFLSAPTFPLMVAAYTGKVFCVYFAECPLLPDHKTVYLVHIIIHTYSIPVALSIL